MERASGPTMWATSVAHDVGNGLAVNPFQRLEVTSWDSDFEMDHFNTYLFILDEIDSFSGVLLKLDPRSGDLI